MSREREERLQTIRDAAHRQFLKLPFSDSAFLAYNQIRDLCDLLAPLLSGEGGPGAKAEDGEISYSKATAADPQPTVPRLSEERIAERYREFDEPGVIAWDALTTDQRANSIRFVRAIEQDVIDLNRAIEAEGLQNKSLGQQGIGASSPKSESTFAVDTPAPAALPPHAPVVEAWAVVDGKGRLFESEPFNDQATAERRAAHYNGLSGWHRYQPLTTVRLSSRFAIPQPPVSSIETVRRHSDVSAMSPMTALAYKQLFSWIDHLTTLSPDGGN